MLFQYEPELDAFLEFLIRRFSIWVNKPTPGNALMNLRYRDERAVEVRGKGSELFEVLYVRIILQILCDCSIIFSIQSWLFIDPVKLWTSFSVQTFCLVK